MDTKGNVYVTDDSNNRVLKLPAGTNNQVELPLTVLNPQDVAVDTAGNVYVTDNSRVLKLSAGSNTPIELPFMVRVPMGVAVDSAAADTSHRRRIPDRRGRGHRTAPPTGRVRTAVPARTVLCGSSFAPPVRRKACTRPADVCGSWSPDAG